MDRGDKFTLIDVREPHEYAIAQIPGSKLVPLATVKDRLHEFDTADEIVLQCKMGGRSAQALQVMKQAGFKKLKNLIGGITAWSMTLTRACRNTEEIRHGLKSEAEKGPPSRRTQEEDCSSFRPLDGGNWSASDFNPWRS